MSHGQIDARGKWKRLQSYYMRFHSADHLCNDINARAGEEECATFVQSVDVWAAQECCHGGPTGIWDGARCVSWC